MRLQDMPVLDRMYPGANYVPLGFNKLKSRTVSPDLFQSLSEFKRFKLDDGMRIQTPHGNELWDPKKIFGHLALPFPKVWIEWENRREDSPGSGICTPWPMAAACVHKSELVPFMLQLFGATANYPDNPNVPPSLQFKFFESGAWTMFLFEATSGIPRLIPGCLTIQLDESGLFLGIGGEGANVFGTNLEEKTSALTDLGWDALSAIGWLNCKNVTTEENDRSMNVKKRRRPNRDRAAILNFHTINLPGRANSGEKIDDSKSGSTALHMARGHFKTFTEDAPLMGKHVGTYWWGWQVRGNPKNGVIVTDYKLTA